MVEAKLKGKTYAKPVVKEKEGAKDLVAALKASLEKTKKNEGRDDSCEHRIIGPAE